MQENGSAGTPAVYASNLTPDDFAFDLLGNLYVATEPSMSVVRIFPDGTQETIASAADGLENTSAVLFGRNGAAILDLYILSGSQPPAPTSHPGVYRLDVGLPGFPVSIPQLNTLVGQRMALPRWARSARRRSRRKPRAG